MHKQGAVFGNDELALDAHVFALAEARAAYAQHGETNAVVIATLGDVASEGCEVDVRARQRLIARHIFPQFLGERLRCRRRSLIIFVDAHRLIVSQCALPR